jgi:hypothetical protein
MSKAAHEAFIEAAGSAAKNPRSRPICGISRVADIYFTEFNRIFYHYYFRSVQEATFKRDEAEKADQQTLFLDETDGWTSKYKRGSLKRKRVAIFAQMEGFESA